jgi:hypothetical protein
MLGRVREATTLRIATAERLHDASAAKLAVALLRPAP